jgi:hypothetical protein
MIICAGKIPVLIAIGINRLSMIAYFKVHILPGDREVVYYNFTKVGCADCNKDK